MTIDCIRFETITREAKDSCSIMNRVNNSRYEHSPSSHILHTDFTHLSLSHLHKPARKQSQRIFIYITISKEAPCVHGPCSRLLHKQCITLLTYLQQSPNHRIFILLTGQLSIKLLAYVISPPSFCLN